MKEEEGRESDRAKTQVFSSTLAQEASLTALFHASSCLFCCLLSDAIKRCRNGTCLTLDHNHTQNVRETKLIVYNIKGNLTRQRHVPNVNVCVCV